MPLKITFDVQKTGSNIVANKFFVLSFQEFFREKTSEEKPDRMVLSTEALD